MKKLPPIPDGFSFGEYVVPVVQLAHRAYAEEAEETERPREARSAAQWDSEDRLIYMDASLSLKRRWKGVRHELIHALTDIINEENGGV